MSIPTANNSSVESRAFLELGRERDGTSVRCAQRLCTVLGEPGSLRLVDPDLAHRRALGAAG
jgi:hypothetical protein